MLFFIIIAIYLKDEVICKCTCDSCYLYTQDTRRKLNVHKTFRRGPGRLQNVLCTFNLIPVSRGHRHIVKLFKERGGRKEYFLQGSYMKQCTQKWTKKNLWRTSFKKSKWYSLLKQTISLQKAVFHKFLFGPFLSIFSHMILVSSQETWRENTCPCTVCYTMLLNHICPGFIASLFLCHKWSGDSYENGCD